MSEHVIHLTVLEAAGESWTLLATELGVCRILFPHDELESVLPWIMKHKPGARLEENRDLFERFGVIEALEDYFAGMPVSFDRIPLDLWGTPFQLEVWKALGRIPHGEVRTYREVAEAIGRPKAVRAVGAANGANPVPVVLPCHRVVGSNKTLVGYRGGLTIKTRLLELEGVEPIEPAGHARFLF
ncbi:methylated-DNA--[protein]-cysteine S-methyltransferase [Paenibacillus gansuensis]|uniref:Methylated-DNA--protein-cysteine methyltransferase n=1 Tax=Paenibacillus gansuensis TaxID=306542 RepID=A0ABW5P9X4_9BACL